MLETLILLCTMAIVIPLIFIAIGVYNLRRKLKGMQASPADEALKDIVRNLVGQQSSPKNSRSKTRARKEPETIKPQVEDAEFREVRS